MVCASERGDNPLALKVRGLPTLTDAQTIQKLLQFFPYITVGFIIVHVFGKLLLQCTRATSGLLVLRVLYTYIGLTRETLYSRFANNKGADQPAHARSLISAFVIRLLEDVASTLVTGEIAIFLSLKLST